MMKFLKLTCLFCLICSFVSGQSTSFILTKEQNEKWIDSLKTLSIHEKLLTIKQRMLADTHVIIKRNYPDGIKVGANMGNRVYGYGKPIIIINSHRIFIENETETYKIRRLAEFIDTNYIKKISILSGTRPTTAIYGSSSLNGVLIMRLTKKKYLKQIKRIKLV